MEVSEGSFFTIYNSGDDANNYMKIKSIVVGTRKLIEYRAHVKYYCGPLSHQDYFFICRDSIPFHST